MANEPTERIRNIFTELDTDLKAISESGWYIEHSSGGCWWFRNEITNIRQRVPRWIAEMVFNAQQAGLSSMQYQLAGLLDLNNEPNYVGPCNPFIPKDNKDGDS